MVLSGMDWITIIGVFAGVISAIIAYIALSKSSLKEKPVTKQQQKASTGGANTGDITNSNVSISTGLSGEEVKALMDDKEKKN